MDDLVELDRGKNFVERGAVGDVAVDEFKRSLAQRLDFAKVAAFELRVVMIVEVIERPDGVAVAQEPFANVRTDEARAAGDQKIHGRTLTIRSAGCRVRKQDTKTLDSLPSPLFVGGASGEKSGHYKINLGYHRSSTTATSDGAARRPYLSHLIQHVNQLPQAAVIAAVETEGDARHVQIVVVFTVLPAWV